MPDETQTNPGAASMPPDKSPNPSPSQIPPSAPAAMPLPTPPSPPPPTIPKSDPPQLQVKEAPGILKVDIGKDALKKFEIHTMADDLGQPSKAPQGLGSSSFTPPPPPKMTPPPPPLSSPSQKSPIPPLPPETPEMLFEEEPKRGGMLKSFLLGFVIILLLGGVGLGTWWYLGFGPTGETPPTTTPTTVSPAPNNNTPKPVVSPYIPLLPMNTSFTLQLKGDVTKQKFFQDLSSLVGSTEHLFFPQDMARIVITKDDNLLTLAEFENILGIDFSPYVDQEAFNLVYSLNENIATYGLVLKITDSKKLSEFFASEEKNIPLLANDIYTDYTNKALPEASSSQFIETVHQGVTIRYLNFGTPKRAFDYALHRNFLLIGGSKDFMFDLVDRANRSPLLDANS